MHERLILMNPGPVLVDERVRQALMRPDMCHREPDFSDLMARVSERLTGICGGDERHTTVVLTGSGTAALEATLSAIVPTDGKMLILANGHYGERLARIVEVHNIPHAVLRQPWAAPFDLEIFERTLAGDPSITHVGMVHHETSTGMLNPLHSVGSITARHGRSLMVDAISSLGGETLDIMADCVDWCVGTANKCLEGVPGLSFVCAPHLRFETLATIPARIFSLNLYHHYVAAARDRAPPFTPAVQTLFALDAALDLLLREGVEARIARYSSRAEELRVGLQQLGLAFLLRPPDRSNTLTAVSLPDQLPYQELHDRLKASGFVIYAGQEELKQRIFRVANMGQIVSDDIHRFLTALGHIVREVGCRGS